MKQMTPIQPTPFFPPGSLEAVVDALRDVRPWAFGTKAPVYGDVVSYAKSALDSSPLKEGY